MKHFIYRMGLCTASLFTRSTALFLQLQWTWKQMYTCTHLHTCTYTYILCVYASECHYNKITVQLQSVLTSCGTADLSSQVLIGQFARTSHALDHAHLLVLGKQQRGRHSQGTPDGQHCTRLHPARSREYIPSACASFAG